MKLFRATTAIFALLFCSQMPSLVFARPWPAGTASAPANPQFVCQLPSSPDYALQNSALCITELKGVKVVKYDIQYIRYVAGTMMFSCKASMVLEGGNIMHFDVQPYPSDNKSIDLFCPLLQEAAISKTKLDVQVVPTPGEWYLIGASVASENP